MQLTEIMHHQIALLFEISTCLNQSTSCYISDATWLCKLMLALCPGMKLDFGQLSNV